MRDGDMKSRGQLVIVPLGIVACLLLLILVERRPGYFTNTTYLGAIVALQIVLVGLSHFEAVFFPLLMGTFLWAGSMLPYNGTGMSLRWLFLGAGALGGFVIWIKTRRARHFGPFHLVAFFCVVSATVSAMVSEVPRTAVLKVLSLFLLFLYASAGGRVAIAGRENKFIKGLVHELRGLSLRRGGVLLWVGFQRLWQPQFARSDHRDCRSSDRAVGSAGGRNSRSETEALFRVSSCVAVCFTRPIPAHRS